MALFWQASSWKKVYTGACGGNESMQVSEASHWDQSRLLDKVWGTKLVLSKNETPFLYPTENPLPEIFNEHALPPEEVPWIYFSPARRIFVLLIPSHMVKLMCMSFFCFHSKLCFLNFALQRSCFGIFSPCCLSCVCLLHSSLSLTLMCFKQVFDKPE